MYRRPIILVVSCVIALSLFALPAEAQAGQVWDCLFGCAPAPQTTYAPAFVPTCVAPAYTPCVSSCSPCVTQSCQYMPTTVYSPVYQAATVTTYRPFLGTYQTRLVPYTTYRPVYVPTVTYQSCYPSCVSACPSPCATCPSYSSCGVSASGCSSCAAPAQVTLPTAPQAAPRTYRESEKPAVNGNLKPIPQTDAQLNSTPAPSLPDPNNRTAARPVIRQAYHVQAVSRSTSTASGRNDSGWYGAD